MNKLVYTTTHKTKNGVVGKKYRNAKKQNAKLLQREQRLLNQAKQEAGGPGLL